MDIETIKAAMEAILFSAGREVKITEFMSSLELSEEEAISILNSLASDYNAANRGVKIIRMEDSYQMASKKEFYNYIYPIYTIDTSKVQKNYCYAEELIAA